MKNIFILIVFLLPAFCFGQPAGYSYKKPVTVESLVKGVKGVPVEANVWRATAKDGSTYLFTIEPNKKGVLARRRIYKK